jgi:negative modulator of initiation of replication
VKTIEIDEDVFGHLLKNVSDFGETPNSVLRRLLGVSGSNHGSSQAPANPVQSFLNSTEFRFSKGAVGRFLAILSWLYTKQTDQFKVVEAIRGRGRIYFSTSAEELELSGRSVNPKRIPNSPYWVITTTPTELKKEMLSEVMKALGYDSASIRIAVAAIAQ